MAKYFSGGVRFHMQSGFVPFLKNQTLLMQEIRSSKGLKVKLLQEYSMNAPKAFDQEKGYFSFASLVAKLLSSGKKLGVAESCTGGIISSLFTSIPGSSDWFKGSVIAYSNEVKRNLLGVSEETLKRYGAVSEETAQEMTLGVQKILNVECALAVTGIAGPGGGTQEKGVGTVCLAWSIDGKINSVTCKFSGTRQDVRMCSMHEGINRLLAALTQIAASE